MQQGTLKRIADGRTDLVFDYLAAGNGPDATDDDGVSLAQWCAYYGDVSALKFLISHGARLDSLGENIGLDPAAFHMHWRLCQFLIESGADANHPHPETGETPLHAALCRDGGVAQVHIVRVLLAAGADPNYQTRPNIETGGFMRDVRTKAETPLHRAAAFAPEETIRLLLDAGAKLDTKDMNGDTPLSWASWYLRPTAILRMLCFGNFHINPNRMSMSDYLQGKPQI